MFEIKFSFLLWYVSRIALLAGGDVLALLLFAAIGRFSHGFPVFDIETLRTADPFVAGTFKIFSFLGLLIHTCCCRCQWMNFSEWPCFCHSPNPNPPPPRVPSFFDELIQHFVQLLQLDILCCCIYDWVLLWTLIVYSNIRWLKIASKGENFLLFSCFSKILGKQVWDWLPFLHSCLFFEISILNRLVFGCLLLGWLLGGWLLHEWSAQGSSFSHQILGGGNSSELVKLSSLLSLTLDSIAMSYAIYD